ncbi:MAG: NAD(P)-dependent oxidoreductase [Candidatus Latescibacterota bacterium]|nr:NAD(P)-dependent oxidoreductase [Candidatus Latescibacterota bacterium]
MRVLITGTSGFVGGALAADMAADHEVVCLSRQPTEVAGVAAVVGDFARLEGLHLLDHWNFDALVHLAAVTGAGSEADLMRVNVLGTYELLRYLVDRGCEKFVLASSIAAVGMQSVHFRPLELPMSDEHPCLDRDGYGFSKYMMEETTRYLSRQREALDFINIRLASFWPEDREPVARKPGLVGPWGMGSISCMYLSDAVRCFRLAAENEKKQGVRIMNAVGGQACVEGTVPELMRVWYGEDAGAIAMGHYERVGHERDPVYDISRIEKELGFVPLRKVVAE